MKTQKNCIILCGPTASGKTHLGVSVAAYYDGEIISADSRQVYRGMDIGTGKDLDEYFIEGKNIPCHLIDIANPSEVYTLYHYQKDFYRVFREISERNHLPVIVGGTGLYIEAVIKKYTIPGVPENQELRKTLMQRSKTWLENELFRLDPLRYEKTDRTSKKRIVRALEIMYSSEADKQQVNEKEIPTLSPVVMGVQWDRQVLRNRIDQRLKQRLEQGMVDEVRRLLSQDIPSERFAMFGMEYKHVARYIRGDVSYEQMIGELQYDIHRLAKRQETWFRGMARRGIDIHWIEKGDKEKTFMFLEHFNFTAGS
jgi:tRNA dimethylallyltransferase